MDYFYSLLFFYKTFEIDVFHKAFFKQIVCCLEFEPFVIEVYVALTSRNDQDLATWLANSLYLFKNSFDVIATLKS
jgi:hypothetical protein